MELLDATCALADLTPALGFLAKVLDAHSALPELGGIECEARDDDTLILRATNLSLYAAVRLPAAVRAPGRTLVPGLAFRDLAARCPGDTATLVQPDPDHLRMQYGPRRRATWNVLSHDPLPTFPDPQPKPAPMVLRLDPARVISIPRTHAPVGAHAPNPPLQTIAIRPDAEGHLSVLATDGIRVSRTRLDPSGFDAAAAIVPVAFWQRLADSLALTPAASPDDPPEPIAVSLDATVCQARIGRITLTARLRGDIADYPDVSRAIPPAWITTGTVSRTAWLQAVQRLRILTAETRSPAICIAFTPPNTCLCVTDDHAEHPMGRELLDAAITGSPLTMRFDPERLIQSLQLFTGETLTFALAGAEAPIRLTDPEDLVTDHLLMPLRIPFDASPLPA